jgi:phosphocarrier protein
MEQALEQKVFKRVLKIKNKLGLHARAAALFVQTANRYRCKVRVCKFKEREYVNGKSIMGVLMLAVTSGKSIIVETMGPDAEDALSALSELVESGFGEG